MINFNPAIQDTIINFANKVIDPACLSDPDDGKGIVTDPHISVLTDMHSAILTSEQKEFISKLPEFRIDFGDINFFKNEKVDVIKIDIISEKLNYIHYQLRSIFPNSYKFDEYHPHCTLAFVKPDSCNSMVQYASYFHNINSTINYINFNSSFGVGFPIKINKI